MKGTRTELLEKIDQSIHFVSSNKRKSDDVKEELSKYRILEGRVEEYFSDPMNALEKADIRELALVAEQVYLKSGNQELNPENWFTAAEMKEARQFDYLYMHDEDEIQFPLIIKDVVHLNNGVYSAHMEAKLIAALLKSKKLNYNFDIQRQEKKVKRMNEVLLKPMIYPKKVKEIKNLLLKGELFHSPLSYNAAPGTSDDGDELVYDAKNRTLTINEGTRLDVLDGFHRTLGTAQAISENPELDFSFPVMITNFTTKQAQQFQAQHARATPITKSRITELEASRLSDQVVQLLKVESELKGKISSSSTKISLSKGELVSYTVLSDAIDREFPNMKLKKDAREVARYLEKFFEELIENNPEQFLEIENYDKSLMGYNKMFAGYIALAAKMKEKNIELDELNEILDKVDFKRDNNLWKELGVIDETGRISNKVREVEIANYFKKLV